MMKNLTINILMMLVLLWTPMAIAAQTNAKAPMTKASAAPLTTESKAPTATDTLTEADLMADSLVAEAQQEEALDEEAPEETGGGFHQVLKQKFIEGNVGFMSLVALALILGLAFCIERIIYLSLSEIDAKKFMTQMDEKLTVGDVEGAKDLARDTRGPVASICYQGLLRIHEGIDNIERSITAYGTVQVANLEKGCSWITLFIAMAPSLGFLGTVVGMVMAFEDIQLAGDISPTIVAAGMKVALITTIFGIIVALILQLFYHYILSKIDHLVSQMEESAVSLLDTIIEYKRKQGETNGEKA